MTGKRGRTLLYLVLALAMLTAKYPVGRWLDSVGRKNGLTTDSLGDVNPVGGTAQLVCFGLRGVAVSLLWNEVIELQKKERWFEMRPALTSITLLQPHFVSPWRFQAWNMAYNIAAAWESVNDKFFWISEGIKFIKDANRTLKNVPDLQWYAGFMYYHKINIADESVYLRQVFRDPQHADAALTACRTPRAVPDPLDNAYDWFKDANAVVLGTGGAQPKPPKGMSIVPFMANQARARISYAEWMRKEGRFGPDNREAWYAAAEEWRQFGMGFTFVREPGKSERYQYIHRLEYEPAEFKALNDEDRYWVQHNGNIVRYWHTRTKIAAEKSPELQAFRQRSYEALAAQNERQDVDAAVAKAKEAFPQLIALVRKPEWAILKEDVELVDDAVELQAMYMKLAPRGANQAPVKPPLNEFFPMVGEMQAFNEDADRAPARQPNPAEAKKAKETEAAMRKANEEKMKKPSETPKK